jgi:hypothetical protein
MPSRQEILNFYRDWNRDPLEHETRDATGWTRLSVAPFHQRAAPRRVARSGKILAVPPQSIRLNPTLPC